MDIRILSDIKSTINLTRKLRKTRKKMACADETVAVKSVCSIPVFKTSSWGFTPEFCILHGDTGKAVQTVFETFDIETQHALTFAPKDAGAFVERVRFWQRMLKPVLPSAQYHQAIMAILDWSIKVIKTGKAATV